MDVVSIRGMEDEEVREEASATTWTQSGVMNMQIDRRATLTGRRDETSFHIQTHGCSFCILFKPS
jgi:hypothetical protein